jgi:hypothetical protein
MPLIQELVGRLEKFLEVAVPSGEVQRLSNIATPSTMLSKVTRNSCWRWRISPSSRAWS